MSNPRGSTACPAGLEPFANPHDPRRDLHLFVDYVRNHEVKRMHRTNEIPRGHARRLLKLMGSAIDPTNDDHDRWLDYVDFLALRLGFVSYDTKGTYAGYTSREPSFPDNYITFEAGKYAAFLALTPQQQERVLFKALIERYSYNDNEFFSRSVLGRLDRFSSSGCGLGVVPQLDFAAARRVLFTMLGRCESGVWYRTADLIRQLKEEHAHFLIPKNPKYTNPSDKLRGRYGNFVEGKSPWDCSNRISVEDPDAFERVEGRYGERFLEGIPLEMGYVEVAYGEPRNLGRHPSLNQLQAFKVSDALLRFLRNEIPAPKVTVKPDFEIHVESQLYPAGVLSRLLDIARVVSTGIVTVLKLDRAHLTARLAEDGDLDPLKLLAELSGHPLPQNVQAEIEEWAGHAETFTLYDGFALFEGDAELSASVKASARQIVPAIRLLVSPETLFDELEKAERIPLLVTHRKDLLASLPKGARTVFPSKSDEPARTRKKKEVTVSRKTVIILSLSTTEFLEKFRKAMIHAGCPIEVDVAARTISYPAPLQSRAGKALKALGKEVRLQIQDIE